MVFVVSRSLTKLQLLLGNGEAWVPLILVLTVSAHYSQLLNGDAIQIVLSFVERGIWRSATYGRLVTILVPAVIRVNNRISDLLCIAKTSS